MVERPVRVSLGKENFLPRDASITKDTLTGILTVKCEVSEDPLSFIHIGTGGIMMEVNKSIKEIRELGKLESTLRRQLDLIRYDYYEIVKYGGKVCIPGSTVKGMCRSRIELSTVTVDGKTNIGFRQVTPPPRSLPPQGTQGWRHFRIWSPSTWEDRGLDLSLIHI